MKTEDETEYIDAKVCTSMGEHLYVYPDHRHEINYAPNVENFIGYVWDNLGNEEVNLLPRMYRNPESGLLSYYWFKGATLEVCKAVRFKK